MEQRATHRLFLVFFNWPSLVSTLNPSSADIWCSYKTVKTVQEQGSEFLVSGLISPSFEGGLHKVEHKTELRQQLKLICSWLEICAPDAELENHMSENHSLWILFHTNQTLSPRQCLSGICCALANALRVYRSFPCRQWDGDIGRGEIKVLSAFAVSIAKTMSGERHKKHCRLKKNCRSCHYNWYCC